MISLMIIAKKEKLGCSNEITQYLDKHLIQDESALKNLKQLIGRKIIF